MRARKHSARHRARKRHNQCLLSLSSYIDRTLLPTQGRRTRIAPLQTCAQAWDACNGFQAKP